MKLGPLLGLLIPLTLAAGTAHAADPVGYVDMTKAIGDTQDGKKAQENLKADQQLRQQTVNLADSNAKQAADRCTKLTGSARATCDGQAAAARQQADELLQRNENALQQRKNDDAGRIAQRLRRIVPTIGVAHRLDRVENSSGAIWISPKLDFTAELVSRYDKGEGKTDDQVAAELRQKNADLERDKADSAKRIAELEAKVAAKTAAPAPATASAPPSSIAARGPNH
jgi:Skp family chaperone for outer membrane proteins